MLDEQPGAPPAGERVGGGVGGGQALFPAGAAVGGADGGEGGGDPGWWCRVAGGDLAGSGSCPALLSLLLGRAGPVGAGAGWALRLIVHRGRPSSAAMAVWVAPSRSRSAIAIRASTPVYRAEISRGR